MRRSVSSAVRAAPGRSAFTLIELLIMIAIIAILVGLLTAGIMKVISKGPDIGDGHDIKELELAVQKFYTTHKVYPPDYVKLCHFAADYNNSALDQYSRQIIERIWPSIFKDTATPVPWAGFNINYSAPPPGPWTVKQLPTHPVTGQKCVVLQGDQCLVFFLGGPLGTRGFTASASYPLHDAINPAFTASKLSRNAYYEFLPNRLAVRPVKVAITATSPFTNNMPEFPSFFSQHSSEDDTLIRNLDRPFVYFAGGNNILGTRGYNPLFRLGGIPHRIDDLDGVQPYFENAGNPAGSYLNPDTFQIISAGLNRKFGPIGQWKGGLSQAAAPNEDWKDNRANFSPNQLGVGP